MAHAPERLVVGEARAAREEEDAHLWASDATLFARTIEAGPDLYASDAVLFSAGDARDHGADLWASDAALFATSEDHARRELAALRRWLVARAEAGPRQSAPEPERVCAVCLGEMGNAGRADAHDEKKAPDERDPRSVALRCGHAYHLRCMLAVLDARTETPLCPSCRRLVRRDADDETPPDVRAETVEGTHA